MQQEIPVARIVRFGSFEVDLKENRMTKSGLRIRLQGQPFQILTLLLERSGEVVSREEIRQRLWSDETFVEFDDALNTAVGKLRAALGDPADNPRFVETVHRRGYRFVAPVTYIGELRERRSNVGSRSSQERTSSGEVFSTNGLEKKGVLTDPGESKVTGSSTLLVETSGFPLNEDQIENGIAGKQPDADAGPIAVRPLSRANFASHPRVLVSVAAAGGVLLALTGVGLYRHFHRAGSQASAFQVSAKDTIVVADFVNTTGEAVFEDALRQGLEIGLEQSPSIKVLPDRKSSVILKQMGRSPEERITGKVAIEVCQRAGGKVEVQGSIASLGTAYLIGLATIQCNSGDPIANEQVQAKSKEEVVDALGVAVARLRSRLGESLPSIQKYNAPLEQATTASLDALNAYGLALSTWDKKGNRDSLPIFKHAVDLDPNFAQAYSGLATVYHNLGESQLARENAAKAYELRSRVTQAERANIEARYYNYVTGELEKTAEVRALEVQNFPDSPGAYNHLGNVEEALGRYEQSTRDYRKALLLDPTRAGTYSDLASTLLALNKLDEAAGVLKEAAARNLQTDLLAQANYWVAFLNNDRNTMQRLVQQSAGKPGVQAMLLSEQSDSEAYFGRMASARELSRKAAALLESEGDKESAAIRLSQAAIREAEAGDAADAHSLIAQAQKLSNGRDVMILSAVTMARVGRVQQANLLIDQLNKDWPAGTYVQRYWLPVIRAQINLRQGRPAKALGDLNAAVYPLELACPPALPAAALYPAYLRGQAYLALGDGARAATEFGKFLEYSNLTVNYPLGALARLGIARSYARTGEIEKSRKAYAEFLGLWKDSDPHLPILQKSKAEYASLPD